MPCNDIANFNRSFFITLPIQNVERLLQSFFEIWMYSGFENLPVIGFTYRSLTKAPREMRSIKYNSATLLRQVCILLPNSFASPQSFTKDKKVEASFNHFSTPWSAVSLPVFLPCLNRRFLQEDVVGKSLKA